MNCPHGKQNNQWDRGAEWEINMEDESHNIIYGIPTQPWVITVIQIYRCVKTIENAMEHILSNNTRSKTEERALGAKFAWPRRLDRNPWSLLPAQSLPDAQ